MQQQLNAQTNQMIMRIGDSMKVASGGWEWKNS
jgi:hypothetical protein